MEAALAALGAQVRLRVPTIFAMIFAMPRFALCLPHPAAFVSYGIDPWRRFLQEDSAICDRLTAGCGCRRQSGQGPGRRSSQRVVGA